jgi:chromosome partitioning protein
MAQRPVDRDTLRRTIAVVNGKGGVGKTSITSNLAGLFAAAGYRVLAIDLDTQGNLGNDFGYKGAGLSDDGRGLLTSVVTDQPLSPLVDVRPGLDVIPGGRALYDLTSLLVSRRERGTVPGEGIAATLSTVTGDYDLALIDCPPGNEILQGGALAAARWVLIPTKTDDASREGLREVAERFTAARETNPDLELLGVVLFGINTTARRIMRQAREALATDLGASADTILTATIRHVEAAAVDARNRGQLVHELERDVVAAGPWYQRLRRANEESTAAVVTAEQPLAASATSLAGDYEHLAKEVLDRVVASETAGASR